MCDKGTFMKYKHIVWDWNGTIVNDIDLCVDVFNTMARQIGLLPVTKAEYTARFRFPVIDFYKERGFDFQKHSYKKVGEVFIKNYNAHRFECPLNKGVPECLEFFAKRGLKQSVLSAYKQNLLNEAVANYKLGGFFENVAGLDNIYAESKTELAKALAKRLDCKPHEILMIGDTCHDKQSADAMGADCALVALGHNSFERLRAANKYAYKNFGELLNALSKE